MTRRLHIVKINFPGGVMPAGLLLPILEAAEAGGISTLRFGSRQQLYLESAPDKLEKLCTHLAAQEASFEVDADEYPNITSSYVAESILYTGGWTRESVYKDILEAFDFRPRVKVNLVDSAQNLVPFHTGHLNFVASSVGNYWHLLVRVPGSDSVREWPSLVYSGHIPQVCRLLEEHLVQKEVPQLDIMYRSVLETGGWVVQRAPEPLALPEFALPYYEGFNRYAQGLWLGIYKRDERFSIPFLKEVCYLGLRTKVSQLFCTPWKSVIIKGIAPSDRRGWDLLLGKYMINVRHALNELCWQAEDGSEDGLALRNYLVRHFEKEDVRTFGLCFAVQVQPGSRLFASVLVRKAPKTSASRRKSMDRYDLFYAKDFNPHSREYVLFRKDVEKDNLAPYLFSLCKYYYECRSGEEMIPHHAYRADKNTSTDSRQNEAEVYQCRHCLTIYDPEVGDPENGMTAGMRPDQQKEFSCPVCEAGAEDFTLVARPVAVA